MERTIPIIDISPLLQNTPDKFKVAQGMHEACKNYGFFYITGHGIDPRLEENLENQSRQFFSLPLEEKQKISMQFGGRAWRGFFPLGDELTSGKPDMKEGIYLGAELSPDHPLVQAETPLHGPNLFPENIPGFKETILEWISEITKLGHKLMAGIALSLDLDENYFESIFSPDPLPLFRIFNYPALDKAQVEERGSWGVAEHTDYGVLTILKQDTLGGLEVKSQGEWIQAPPIPGTFVCNIGDMLDRVTGGLYRSNPHRVRSPTNTVDRISFPLFFDPNFNARVNVIEKLNNSNVQDDEASRWDKSSVHAFEGTYGDYLLNKVSKVFPELKRKML
ncbi:unnamed protein product [Allacma fusca]|uniref:Fe2OG dioxygenase domain-containing protein n=1 Tax=Allacma fusca TaxID=39272 RepID=A0A8J2K4W1_9HEXA|nr:unnamed protein product [Allacma fusca]